MNRTRLAGAPFFLVDTIPVPGPFVLDGPEGRHASLVRRMRVGELLVLSDGAGRIAGASVTAVAKGSVEVTVDAAVDTEEPAVRVTLVQALPKGERSELSVELATEAGVDALVPWAASRCVARWSPEKSVRGTARWQTVAREAAKQSRRPSVPPVSPLASTDTVARLIESSTAALVLHEAGSIPITAARLPAAGDVVLVVGPEGGLSPDELAAFTSAGAQVVRLGREVLRTSTAGAVALGALGVLCHRWTDPATDDEAGEQAVR